MKDLHIYRNLESLGQRELALDYKVFSLQADLRLSSKLAPS